MLFFPLKSLTFPYTMSGTLALREREIHLAPLNQTNSISPVESLKYATNLLCLPAPTVSHPVICPLICTSPLNAVSPATVEKLLLST